MSLPDIERGIYSALSTAGTVTNWAGTADSGLLNVYSQLAPQAVAPPYIVFYEAGVVNDLLSPNDLYNVVYRVEAVGRNRGEAQDGAQRVHSVLHGGSVIVTGYGTIFQYVSSQQNFLEDISGTVYHRRVLDVRIRLA